MSNCEFIILIYVFIYFLLQSLTYDRRDRRKYIMVTRYAEDSPRYFSAKIFRADETR